MSSLQAEFLHSSSKPGLPTSVPANRTAPFGMRRRTPDCSVSLPVRYFLPSSSTATPFFAVAQASIAAWMAAVSYFFPSATAPCSAAWHNVSACVTGALLSHLAVCSAHVVALAAKPQHASVQSTRLSRCGSTATPARVAPSAEAAAAPPRPRPRSGQRPPSRRMLQSRRRPG